MQGVFKLSGLGRSRDAIRVYGLGFRVYKLSGLGRSRDEIRLVCLHRNGREQGSESANPTPCKLNPPPPPPRPLNHRNYPNRNKRAKPNTRTSGPQPCSCRALIHTPPLLTGLRLPWYQDPYSQSLVNEARPEIQGLHYLPYLDI